MSEDINVTLSHEEWELILMALDTSMVMGYDYGGHPQDIYSRIEENLPNPGGDEPCSTCTHSGKGCIPDSSPGCSDYVKGAGQ